MLTTSAHSVPSGADRSGQPAWRRALAIMLIALLSPVPALFAFWADASGDWLPDSWVDPASGHVFTLAELDAFSDDIDGDGLSNSQEMALGANPFSPDTDGDGISDLLDPLPLSVSNLSPANGIIWGAMALDDADGDGISNFLDDYPYGQYGAQLGTPDTDGDGIPDIIDPAPWDYSNWSSVNGRQWLSDALADADGDGVPNFHDWYPDDSALWDPLQDPDGDGFVKARDPHPADPYNPSPVNGVNWGPDVYGDADGDGIPNFYDVYPYDSGNGYVPPEPDSDGDGIPDSVDPSPWDYDNFSAANGVSWQGDARGDADGDGISNFYDQFPYDYYNGNMPVSDMDSDGIPDAEDPAPTDPANLSPINGGLWHTAALADADGDGNPNFTDPWPYDPTNGNLPPEWNSATADTDGDGIPNAQDPALADPLNFSIYNGTSWYAGAIGDIDGDGIPNFRDEHPYDYYNGGYAGPDSDGDGIPDSSDPYPNDPNNGNGDADGDGIPDITDPAQSDPDNLSPINGYGWYGDVRGDADGDTILNFWDSEPYGPRPADADGDGLIDSVDPAPLDPGNFSTYNKASWSSSALGDADGDGIPNFFDTWPYDSLNGTGDVDMDGLPDASDPVPDDPYNNSPHNGAMWSGPSALGDADNDGILNYFDAYPDDPYDGLPPGGDADGDGIPNEQDPDPRSEANTSPHNGINWGEGANGDVDGDGTANYWDYSPYGDDLDGDGIRDSDDPAPNDATNTSWINGRAWYGEALNDNDLDNLVNFSDPTPDGGMPYEPYLGEQPSATASPLVLLNDGYDELGEPAAPGVTPDSDMADESLVIKSGSDIGTMATKGLTPLSLSLPAEYVDAGGSVTITQSSGAGSVRIHAVLMEGGVGVGEQPVALGSAFVPPSYGSWTYWIEGVTEGDVSLNLHFPQKTYGGVDSLHQQGAMAEDIDVPLDFMVCSAHLSVDYDRDGVIAPGSYADAAFEYRPFRFWINEDSDSLEQFGKGGDTDVEELIDGTGLFHDYAAIGQSGRREIACKRDLEDFAMMSLHLGNLVGSIKQGSLRVGISVSGTGGVTPSINMFRCAPQLASPRDHVSDDQKAATMVHVPVSLQVGPGLAEDVAWLTAETLGLSDDAVQPDEFNFLFEGVGVGTGAFKVIIEQLSVDEVTGEAIAGAQVVACELHVKLMHAGEMVQRVYAAVDGSIATPSVVRDPWTYRDGVNQQQWGWLPDDKFAFEPDPDESEQRVIHVHGWRMDDAEKRNWSEMSFKRLWHQGYKGRVCAFSWPTYGPENSNVLGYLTYNLSEYRAWLAGESLRQFAGSLGNAENVKVFAHSMGNVVVGSAIKKGMYVGGYVMQHAAMAAQAYDPSAVGLLHPDLQDSPTPDGDSFYENRMLGLNDQFGLQAFTKSSKIVNCVNFCLPADSALDWWVFNQRQNKPSTWNTVGWYNYDPNWVQPGKLEAQDSVHLSYSANLEEKVTNGGRAVVSLYEALGFVTKARTFPVGAALRTGGSVTGALDLNEFGFGEDHSAEWNWNIQHVSPYWACLILKLKLVPQSE